MSSVTELVKPPSFLFLVTNFQPAHLSLERSLPKIKGLVGVKEVVWEVWSTVYYRINNFDIASGEEGDPATDRPLVIQFYANDLEKLLAEAKVFEVNVLHTSLVAARFRMFPTVEKTAEGLASRDAKAAEGKTLKESLTIDEATGLRTSTSPKKKKEPEPELSMNLSAFLPATQTTIVVSARRTISEENRVWVQSASFSAGGGVVEVGKSVNLKLETYASIGRFLTETWVPNLDQSWNHNLLLGQI
ncbi:hypothetical protein K435DRAFT_839880 [Dendrothele bispora CBS 962.96]|uniref:Uncharacterized protein n=1 Tax=Dendrothele bispora (strain CBS 962.96) TaxID=1314807 RepID=A0A4V4HFC4_DENBC|nr:hypothetical protein K435DRAFT_839880 [Dendrothele bispora CBS 962.96]